MSVSAPTTLRGLTHAEAEASRARHGANVLTPPPRDPWWKQYFEKFNDPVIRILMIAAAIAIAVGVIDGKAAEGVGILVAIFLATFLAFWNEFRANKEFDVLNKSNDDVPVKALREGIYTTVPRRDVVVGDLILVEVGEEVPADGRLLEAQSLLVNEARLTGEARPADKGPDSAPREGSAYGPAQLLRGTVVVDGYGLAEVTAVGDRTEIGRTLRESIEETDEQTPLNRQLARLSQVIGVVGFGVAVLTFLALVGRGVLIGRLALSTAEWAFAGVMAAGILVGLVRVWLPIVFDALELVGWEVEKPGWLEAEGVLPWLATMAAGAVVFGVLLGIGLATGIVGTSPSAWLPQEAGREFLRNFMIAVTIIVVAVPEGLAMSVTLSLAYSMRKMTASNNLVRRMDACETIGAATVICSDKTGTLTLNEMRVFEAKFSDNPHADGTPTPLVVEAVAANTTAHLSREPGSPATPVGNPTEGALLLWLDQHGSDYLAVRKGFAVLSQWTFNNERKFMATLGQSVVRGEPVLHVKGAPEIVLERCTREETPTGAKPLTAQRSAEVAASLKGYQTRGMRTLALAYRTGAVETGADAEAAATGLVWLGFVAIADPIRPEVPGAIAACRGAGVGVKMVTGDNPETALEIARQIGLWSQDDPADLHLTGKEFAALSDADASTAAARLKVLSRARPADKLRLVNLLKERGEVVAVTGDGVNDGPALNHADVGLAMGKSGTAVAKEASDIILLDDSFRSIVNAIQWGRSLYENIQRFILFQLTINVAALGVALLGPFLGFELPLTVMQMLWINLIMDTFAALALATEPAHTDVLRRPPRNPGAFIVSGPMARSIFVVAAAFLVVLVGMILYFHNKGELPPGDEPSRAGTVFFTVFVMLQFWNLFNARCHGRNQTAFAGLSENPSFLLIAGSIFVGQVLLVQLGGSVFRTQPLSFTDWAWITGLTSVVLWIGEAVRLVSRLTRK